MASCPACAHAVRDGARFCEECGARLDAASTSGEQRKVVTVLFCDVTDSTGLGERLDPEPLRALLARYFERMRTIVERHGGTVEKFIGDAVMAVFGVPLVHEDDALRAVRAASEMRGAVPELGLQARIGVATGEVVVGTAERLATGDVVNLAARLEQAAAPGEVLLAEATHRLVRDAVEAVALPSLGLRGKSGSVRAHRLDRISGAPRRAGAAAMVGRGRQLRVLETAFANARDDRACHLVTILGSAGVGKSRLVAEFVGRVEATVVAGRCLSYGEGITYWPVVEVLAQLGERPADERAAAAVGAVVGEAGAAATASEIAWGVRTTFEQAAKRRPLVVHWDDLQWAEEALLDLVDHVADWSRDAPILLVCMARPELLDVRPGWGGGKLNATTMLLEPLTGAETDELLDTLGAVDERLRERVRDAAAGNPLFVEEMLALAAETDGPEVAIPPSIQALLAARLDQLEPADRRVVERAAVEGEVFHRGAVEALADDADGVHPRLRGLVRRDLVRPHPAQLPGDEAFRFRHLLIRDAAYESLPKRVRAELHRRFADWLEGRGGDAPELDEVLGYHLEQSCRYLRELGHDVDAGLAERARRRLAAATERAMRRDDYGAACSLAQRALELVPPGEVDASLELDYLDALGFSQGMSAVAGPAEAALDRARAAGDRCAELHVLVEIAIWDSFIHPEGATGRIEALVSEAMPAMQAAGDDVGLQGMEFALAYIALWRGRGADAIAAFERSMAHALRAHMAGAAEFARAAMAEAHFYGPTSASDLLKWLDEDATASRHHFRLYRGVALAMLGRTDAARAIVDAELALLREQGNVAYLGISSQAISFVAEHAGVTELADRLLADACAMLESRGELKELGIHAARRALVLADHGRIDEAEAAARRALEVGASDYVVIQTNARRALAKVLARRGDHDAAVRLARAALERVRADDNPLEHGGAWADLADVLEQAGRLDVAADAFSSAMEHYRAKGDVVLEGRVRERLSGIAARAR